jgi:guanylate kinase
MSAPSVAHRVIALTAPSGAGKTTIARRLLADRDDLRFSVSATTRAPRDGETDGVHYHFVSAERFREMIEGGELLEFEEVYPGRFYGTLASEVEHALEAGSVLLDVDVVGAVRVKELYADRALTLFVAPPSLDALRQRLEARGTESASAIDTRMERAAYEMGFSDRFDAVIVNDELETAVSETLARVAAFLST